MYVVRRDYFCHDPLWRWLQRAWQVKSRCRFLWTDLWVRIMGMARRWWALLAVFYLCSLQASGRHQRRGRKTSSYLNQSSQQKKKKKNIYEYIRFLKHLNILIGNRDLRKYLSCKNLIFFKNIQEFIKSGIRYRWWWIISLLWAVLKECVFLWKFLGRLDRHGTIKFQWKMSGLLTGSRLWGNSYPNSHSS